MNMPLSRQPITIIAPHVDDEAIGCWSYLAAGRVTEVIYLFELTATRRAEAQAAAREFGFNPVFSTGTLPEVRTDAFVLLPSITDSHPHHQQANRHYRNLPNAKQFYQVDMQAGKTVLGGGAAGLKKQALDRLYPSQKALWATDASYYLFENIQEKDYRCLRNSVVSVNGSIAHVTASTQLASGTLFSSIDDIVNTLVQTCISFRIDCEGEVYESWN